MTTTPHEALARLEASASSGALGELCASHGIALLVAHGSAVEPEPLREPRDLDLAYQPRQGANVDHLAFLERLFDVARFDDVDLMNLQRANEVAKAQALAPGVVVLYEQAPDVFANAQIAALTMEMETRRLRRLDLELMAE